MALADPSTLLELLAAGEGGKSAVILPEPQIHVSYAALKAQVERMGGVLRAAGIGPSDRVALALPNGLPAIVCFLAAAQAGTAAPLNPAYTESEFRFHLEDTNARLLLLQPGGADQARRAASDRIPVLSVDMSASGTVTLGEVDARAFSAPLPALESAALVLHTSGSTGRPKRVPLTHANLTISAGNVARTYALGPDDVSLCVMPLFHVHGLVASTLATLATGGTVVVPERFNPLSFWRIAGTHGVTWYSAVPTLHRLLLARHDVAAGRPAGAERLRFIRSCSAALRPQVMLDLEAAFGAPVIEAYGMTEAAHQMSSNPLPPALRRPGSVGQGTGVGISIMDAGGRHLHPGESGEVVIMGPNVTRGYEDDPEANAAAFVGGWFRTGDQGVLGADGFLTLVGRIKELINRGGEKISPQEIDDVLLAHPAVAEAVCFGVPHPIWGEEVAAAVVLWTPASESDLLEHCGERLAEHKRPKRIYIAESIPRTATGKIQRRAVAQAYRDS
jgi:acyl-CoA synthetase (AMP-forming)/AMP-acid ligase II